MEIKLNLQKLNSFKLRLHHFLNWRKNTKKINQITFIHLFLLKKSVFYNYFLFICRTFPTCLWTECSGDLKEWSINQMNCSEVMNNPFTHLFKVKKKQIINLNKWNKNLI